jgi:nuclear GTP-binding protein
MCVQVRIENVKNPEDHVGAVLERAKKDHLQKTYDIEHWEDANDFLEQLARKYGKLLKGGEPDVSAVAKLVLHDWQRGRIPYYVAPTDEQVAQADEVWGWAVHCCSVLRPASSRQG